MAVEVADIIRIAARMRLDGIGDIINVFHFVVAVQDLLDDSAVMDGVAEILDDLYTTVNGAIADNVTYESVDGQNITKDELLPSKDWPVLTAGGAGSDMLPEMTSCCVFFRTVKPRVRNAKFLPPFTIGSSDDGAVDALTVTALENYGDFLVAPLTVTDLELGYVSFNRVTQVATQVISRVVPTRFRTQRRRRLGVGS